MDKIKTLKEFMFKIKFKKDAEKLFKSEIELITQKLDNQGWDKTFEFILSQRKQCNKDNDLARQITGFYHSIYCKMYKINQV